APGLAMRLGSTPWSAWLLGRTTVAALTLVLLFLGVLAFWDPGAPAVVFAGIALAVTPMALFLAGSLSPSAEEVAGGVCFAAGLLAVLRDRPPPARAWVAVAAGGVVLAASRSLGPYFVVVVAGVMVVAFGVKQAWRRVRGAWVAAAVATVLIGAACLANLVWEATQQPHTVWRLSLLEHLKWGRLPSLGQEMVGVFGWLEFKLPHPTYWIWGILTLVLVGLAVAVGRWRERVALVGMVVGVGLLGLAFHAVLPVETGFDVQGRYLLPIAVAIPLIAAEVLVRRRARLPARALGAFALTAAAVTAFLQGLAWYVNAHRYAVGTSGPRWFLGRAEWSPPGGWLVWIVLAGVGTACLGLGGWLAAAPRTLSPRARRTGSGPVPTGELPSERPDSPAAGEYAPAGPPGGRSRPEAR
ncbi:MAG TPA: DUF2142 domain-containing protein, partial [Acidimicrobiia bacterium]|nr:DUF2142 domain-containing protein [Acidimicrobiia bacterium]